MANYREIVTKAVIAKGKKMFTTQHLIKSLTKPSTILGVWVINHNFKGEKTGNTITINGSYDVNIWYSYDNDSKTNVVKETNNYTESIKMRNDSSFDSDDEIIVRSLKQPNCIKAEIDNDCIKYEIEKELGVELVGDIKVKIQADLDEDPWDEIKEDSDSINDLDKIDPDYIKDNK